MQKNTQKKKAMLVILDGFWYSEKIEWNAINQAKKPFLSKMWKENSTILINASWNSVWLPKWEMWNSESGHITIWSGRVIWQPLEEITQSILQNTFFKKRKLIEAFEKWENLHLFWLFSDWWVHGHIDHLFELLKLAKEKWKNEVFIHLISDWRDVDIKSLEKYFDKLEQKIAEIWIWKICSIIWRFYAMDRDKNLDRTNKFFDLITKWIWFNSKWIKDSLDFWYKNAENDYYIPAISLPDFQKITKKDSIVCWNFRTDRSAQITELFFKNWFKNFLAFGPYTKDFPVLFPPKKVKNNLQEILWKNWIKQLRIAETEKYPHVTFYFNSQNHEKVKWEEHLMVASPKCLSYAEKPEMSANEVTEKIIENLEKNKFEVIIINYANPDLVGHSGKLEASIKAVEKIDNCLSKIIPLAKEKWFEILIWADHWNCEEMFTEKWEPNTKHTSNKVRLTIIWKNNFKLKEWNFWLKDISPTILQILWIEKPEEMSWEGLVF